MEHRSNVLQRIDTTLTMLRQRAEHLEQHVQGGGQKGARQRGVDVGRPRVLKQAPQEARLAQRHLPAGSGVILVHPLFIHCRELLRNYIGGRGGVHECRRRRRRVAGPTA